MRSNRVIRASAVLACAVTVVAAASANASPSKVLPRGGKVVATIPIPAGFGGFTSGEGAVWAVSDAAATLARIDPQTNAVAARIKVETVKECPPYVCGEPAAGHNAVWLPRASDDAVFRIDPSNNTVAATISVGPQPTAVAITQGAVWVANSGGPSISRIDPATNRVVATIRVGPKTACCSPMSMTAAGDALWVAVPALTAVVRVDAATDKVAATIKLPAQPCGFVAAAGTAVWASGASCSPAVMRIDPRTNRRAGAFWSERYPIGLALAFGSLWVGDLERKAIDRLNPRTGRIVSRLRVGGIPIRLAVGFGSIWVRDDTGRVLRINPQ